MQRDLSHSFVVPAYGRSPHLRDCLQSLRAQTVASPIVVATSTPYDGLEALAAEFGARLCVHGPNGGIGRDWNFAVSQADTDLVTIAHQDDIYLPRFAERSIAATRAAPDVSLIATGYGELLGERERFHTPMLLIKRVLLELAFLGRRRIGSLAAKQRALRFGCAISCPTVTLRVDADGPGFREDLKVNLDWDAWLRRARRPGSFVYVRQSLMLHRIHASSETTAAVIDGVRAREDMEMFRALWPPAVAGWLARVYALSYAAGERE
ncbi:glycosyltransferase family 2 protein [Lysobacter sp. CA199]|uniref:glycosyltransferase family 2 protein n=1 Tax=Lysobacter sp. CA199 TaxID=3455608 RepID=UPI003F8D77B6